MKQFLLSALFSLAAIALIVTFNTSCSSDGDSADAPDSSVYVGTWICSSSTDVSEKTGESILNHFKGESITINSDGTYTSTSANFGYNGKYVLKGSRLVVTTSTGQSLSLSISYHSGTMIWEGSANGYRFHYEFRK